MSPRRRAMYALLVAVVLVVVGVVAVRTLGHRDPHGIPPQNNPGTVLLVPGYGGSVDALQGLATAVRNTGRSVRIVRLPDACPTACQQLIPGSRLLAGLKEPVPRPPQWLSRPTRPGWRAPSTSTSSMPARVGR